LRRNNLSLERLVHAIEAVLERERSQLALWVPVALGIGVCAWFALPAQPHWLAWILGWLGLALGFGALSRGGRLGQSLAIGAVLIAAGTLLPWAKATLVGAPPLGRAAVVEMQAQVRSIEPLAARNVTRLLLAPVNRPDLPLQVRVNAPPEHLPAGLAEGDRITVRARLMPPPASALPGAYDFAMRAYFSGIGATGRSLGPIAITAHGGEGAALRTRLGAHVRAQLPGPEGAIAVALATGDQAGLSDADADAMRRSGLAHLLSISGLHVSALIGGVMLIVYRLLALSPTLALRLPLILIAACAGAAAGVGYTLLTVAL
jgi:competence protein ComEC